MDLGFFLSRDVISLCVLLPVASHFLADLAKDNPVLVAIPYGIVFLWGLGIGIDIMRTSVHGQNRMQHWEEVFPARLSTKETACRLVILGIGFLPFILYVSRVTLTLSEEPPNLAVAWLLLVWKDLYMIVVLPAFSVFGDWRLVFPGMSIPGLLRIGAPVRGLLAACSGLSLVCLGLLALYPQWSESILYATFLTLFFLLAFLLQSRWIGAFYHRHMEQLRWF